MSADVGLASSDRKRSKIGQITFSMLWNRFWILETDRFVQHSRGQLLLVPRARTSLSSYLEQKIAIRGYIKQA
jgi:hypothetical protein